MISLCSSVCCTSSFSTIKDNTEWDQGSAKNSIAPLSARNFILLMISGVYFCNNLIEMPDIENPSLKLSPNCFHKS